MYRNEWFHGRNALRQLPLEAVCDCSGPGAADRLVSYWVERLEFDGPPWLFREYLKAFGIWDRADLCDHTQNRRRVLWLWACNCQEDPGIYDYLYLGV